MKRLLCALALAVLAQPAQAVIVNSSRPVAMLFDLNTGPYGDVSFRVYVDGVAYLDVQPSDVISYQVTTPDPAGVATFVVALGPFPEGDHNVCVSSFENNFEVKSDPINLTSVSRTLRVTIETQ